MGGEGASELKMLGIVGHEAAKFTPEAEAAARAEIRAAIETHRPEIVCSGECPLGGVDIWAREECGKLGVSFQPYPPKANNWEFGFKPRNLQIAASDHVVNIVVAQLPPTYRGMKFAECYHCKGRNPPHIKSGGCWTAWKCKSREWRIV